MNLDFPPCDGLLLVAHGARDPRWAEPFQALAAALERQSPPRPVRLAYLELMQPEVTHAGRELMDLGCLDVALVPMLLGAGSHAREDLPRRLAALQALGGPTRWHLAPTLGDWPAFRAAVVTLLATLPSSPGETPA